MVKHITMILAYFSIICSLIFGILGDFPKLVYFGIEAIFFVLVSIKDTIEDKNKK